MEAVELVKEIRDGVELFVDKSGAVIDAPDLEGEDYKVVSEFTPEPAKPEVDERGVPRKNVESEIQRKVKKEVARIIAERDSQTPPKPKVDRIKEYRAKWVDKGLTAEEIDEKVEVLTLAIEQANENMSEQMANIKQPLDTVRDTNNQRQREDLLKDFQVSPEKYGLNAEKVKLIVKHKIAIMKELEEIPLQYEIQPKTLKAVIGTVILDNEDYAKPKNSRELPDDENIVEPATPPAMKLPDGVNKDEFKEFIAEKGFDISTAEKKNVALGAFKKKKEYDKASEPK